VSSSEIAHSGEPAGTEAPTPAEAQMPEAVGAEVPTPAEAQMPEAVGPEVPTPAEAQMPEAVGPELPGPAEPQEPEAAEADASKRVGSADPGDRAPQRPGGAVPGPAEAGASQAAPVTAHIAKQLQALQTLADLPLAEHAQVYQHLHAELQDALADIDGA
jgi:hypothetical protein